MIGRLKCDQGQLFYRFRLGDAVPEDHMVRKIDVALDLPGYAVTSRLTIHPWIALDRSGTDDPDAGREVCVCNPLGAADLP